MKKLLGSEVSQFEVMVTSDNLSKVSPLVIVDGTLFEYKGVAAVADEATATILYERVKPVTKRCGVGLMKQVEIDVVLHFAPPLTEKCYLVIPTTRHGADAEDIEFNGHRFHSNSDDGSLFGT